MVKFTTRSNNLFCALLYYTRNRSKNQTSCAAVNTRIIQGFRVLRLFGPVLIKINTVFANFNNTRPSTEFTGLGFLLKPRPWDTLYKMSDLHIKSPLQLDFHGYNTVWTINDVLEVLYPFPKRYRFPKMGIDLPRHLRSTLYNILLYLWDILKWWDNKLRLYFFNCIFLPARNVCVKIVSMHNVPPLSFFLT